MARCSDPEVLIKQSLTPRKGMFDWECLSCGLKLQVQYGTRFEHTCNPAKVWKPAPLSTINEALAQALTPDQKWYTERTKEYAREIKKDMESALTSQESMGEEVPATYVVFYGGVFTCGHCQKEMRGDDWSHICKPDTHNHTDCRTAKFWSGVCSKGTRSCGVEHEPLTRQQVEDAYRKAGLLAQNMGESAHPTFTEQSVSSDRRSEAGARVSRPYQQSSYDALARWRNPALGEW